MTGANAARAKSAFAKQLREHRKDCGSPSLPQIATISREVSLYYPSRTTGIPSRPDVQLVTLSVTTMSDILSGTVRKKLPPWEWVASFVLCCNRWANQEGFIDDDPGRDALPEWVKRYRYAEQAAQYGTVEVPVRTRAGLATYGAYGESLIEQVEARVEEATYLAVILLGCIPHYWEEALSLCITYMVRDDPILSSLINGDSGDLNPQNAAVHARQLAKNARSPEEAAAFREAAARADKAMSSRRQSSQSGRPAVAPSPPDHRRSSSSDLSD